MTDELRQLVDDIGRRSLDDSGQHGLPVVFDAALWRTLEETGLTRLTTSQDAGPTESAVVLGRLARYAAAVPVAETDVLAAWLAAEAGLSVPATGPMTAAIAQGEADGARLIGTAVDVAWPQSPTVVLAVRTADATHVAVLANVNAMLSHKLVLSHNLAGEPRGTIGFDIAVADTARLPTGVHAELVRRGAWCRSVQIVGAFDAAAELTAAHARERIQFGRPLKAFQAVQHSLAGLIGEIERARAATDLAVVAATDHGFDSQQAEFAIAVAKVAVGRAVGPVTTIAHQLHGAIGVTIEHRLWLATMRARSWADEFGTAGHHARWIGRRTLAAEDPWDLVVGGP